MSVYLFRSWECKPSVKFVQQPVKFGTKPDDRLEVNGNVKADVFIKYELRF